MRGQPEHTQSSESQDQQCAELSAEVTQHLSHIREGVEHLVSESVPRALLRNLDENLEKIQKRLDEQSQRNRYLQEELQEARRDQVALLLNPGIKKLVSLRRSLIDGSVRDYTRAGQINPNEDFNLALEQLDEAITAFGFELLQAAPGTSFDKRFHYAAGTTPTSDPEADKTIAEEVAPGFIYANSKKAVSPARVIVHRYDSNL
ncbi:nucleotide exchange factor GrpE [Corynebacterium mayonis]|uniref:nucleotide exchange factor GrpE n=1 Tax=Corynebacterium mayonis TaxID=3062461 RepID=UPI0031402622